MMPQPFVSIILPVRNEAAHITRCLDSVLALDLDGIEHEILVVDGMSDDGTLAAIKNYESRIASLRVIQNPRRGVAAARNIGIKDARGEVLVLMDAHARYAPDYVRRCLEVMERTGAANVGGPAIALPGGGSALAQAIALAHRSPFGLGGGQFRDPGAEGFVETVWPGCYRREVFAKAGYIDERRSRTEDLEFNTRLRAAGFTIYLSPQIKAWYYCRTTLGETWRQRWADGCEITRFLPDNPSAPRLRHFMPLLFVSSLILLAAAAVFVHPHQSAGAKFVSDLQNAVGLKHSVRSMLFNFSYWDLRISFLRLLLLELLAYLGAMLLFVIKSCQTTFTVYSSTLGNTEQQTLRRPTTAESPTPNGQTGNCKPAFGSMLLLPVVFMTLHFSYGLGSVWGLITLPRWLGKDRSPSR